MKKLFVVLLLGFAIDWWSGWAYAAQGSITFSNVSLSVDSRNPTHSPSKTVPATATGFTVIVTTNPTWTNLAGQGSIHMTTEIELSTGGWDGISGSDIPYGATVKDGTPEAIYQINRSGLAGETLRVTGWSDVPIVVQVTAQWNF